MVTHCVTIFLFVHMGRFYQFPQRTRFDVSCDTLREKKVPLADPAGSTKVRLRTYVPAGMRTHRLTRSIHSGEGKSRAEGESESELLNTKPQMQS